MNMWWMFENTNIPVQYWYFPASSARKSMDEIRKTFKYGIKHQPVQLEFKNVFGEWEPLPQSGIINIVRMTCSYTMYWRIGADNAMQQVCNNIHVKHFHRLFLAFCSGVGEENDVHVGYL